MYHKLKEHDGVILAPILEQLSSLSDAISRGKPAMLAVNEAIAAAAEQSHNLSKLHTAGLLDAQALSARQTEINIKMTELRRQRRKLLSCDEIDDTVELIRGTVGVIRDGPEQINAFDETLFRSLVEHAAADSRTCIRFRLYGGLEFAETLEAR